jgi:hypothetical protein
VPLHLGAAEGLVAQHVRMDREWQFSGLAKPLYHLLSAMDRKGRLALREEHEIRVRRAPTPTMTLQGGGVTPGTRGVAHELLDHVADVASILPECP